MGRMDLDTGVWTIPAARMKAKRDSSRPALGTSARDPARCTETERWHRPSVSQSALEATLQHDALETDQGTRHRRRAAWVPVELPGLGRGATNTPREVVEAALAHTVQNPTEAAYARSDLFERRAPPDRRLARLTSVGHTGTWWLTPATIRRRVGLISFTDGLTKPSAWFADIQTRPDCSGQR